MEIKTKRFVECPECHGYDFSVDHIWNDGRVYNWGCSHCGKEITVSIKDGKPSAKWNGKIYPPTLTFLKLGNFGFIVKGMAAVKEKDLWEVHRYYYEEHTCPINAINNAVAILDLEEGGTDPHGMFTYVDSKIVGLEDIEDCGQWGFKEWDEFFNNSL